ncbi:latent-transforming growth factor beta-binding protein 1-like [Pocillopora verrucosa]|uniref:latent-transforming growth factor beta-binding protein 1-like n=1 Tax=Pocillopora verrucosa TaxID=203993 RepID=UPI00334107C3
MDLADSKFSAAVIESTCKRFPGYAGENAFGKGRHVASLDSPTREPVQTIILRKNIKARFVTLALSNKRLELQFREVEIYNGPLLAIDDCKRPNICPKNFKCVNGTKSYKCVCRDGFREIGTNKCEEIKDCIPACAANNSFCNTSFGSYICECPYGFNPLLGHKGVLLHCEDVNECEKPMSNRCGNTSICVNARGFYNCTCKSGYVLEKSGLKFECKDIDECAMKNSCHVNTTCSNTPGSYRCTCSHGLGGDGYKSCLKLPRCPNGKCKKNAICKDFNGTDLCDCKGGYHFNGKICVDTDECQLDKSICGSNSVCSNTRGSYHCNCEVGFRSDEDSGKNCNEINECEKKDLCGSVAECEDIFGSYKCKCPHGFSYDKTEKKCFDNDECTISHSCQSYMICTNTFGSYSCRCHQGYRADKLFCTDIDECEEMRYDCPKFSSCKNLNGSYECVCKGGYRKESDGTCSEICFPECDENSYCQIGKCLCKKGFLLSPNQMCQAAFLRSSGVSFHSHVLFLITTLLWSLILLCLVVFL